MKKFILPIAALVTISTSSFAQLGSADKDLVYTPVTPCRVLDTRTSQGGTGAIVASGTKHFKIWGQTTYAAQGGKNSDCGITAGSDVAAVAMNFTVVTPAAGGFITAYPFGGALPVAATVNFQVGDIARGDFTIAKVTQSGTNHLSIYSSSLTDVVGDVVGYYSKPMSTGSLECTFTATNTVSVPASLSAYQYSQTATACAAGYRSVSALCENTNAGIFLGGSGVYSAGNTSFCYWRNTTAAPIDVYQSNTCCRIPGR
jgi:hypothetical protein